MAGVVEPLVLWLWHRTRSTCTIQVLPLPLLQ